MYVRDGGRRIGVTLPSAQYPPYTTIRNFPEVVEVRQFQEDATFNTVEYYPRADVVSMAIDSAISFIENGVETGYVTMPSFVADPSHDTLPLLRLARAALSTNPIKKQEM